MFFLQSNGHFRMDCSLFWEAVKNQGHLKHNLALAAVQNTRNRHTENDLQSKEAANGELPTKTVKAIAQVKDAVRAETKSPPVMNYEKAVAEAINRVKQDLATKEIEQRLKHEIERQKMNETLLTTRPEKEAGENLVNRTNCITLKMVTGKPFVITKIGARIMSIITVGGHEVTRNLSEPSDQRLMHIDVYVGYLRTTTPQTPSRALRKLLTRVGGKSIRIDNRYTEAYGPHEVMLNIDGINVYTKTMITCDEDIAGKIYVGRKELKMRSIGHCTMLEEGAMHLGAEADVSAHLLDISGKKTQMRGLLDTGAVLRVIPIEVWRRMGFDKDDLIDSRIRLLAVAKSGLCVSVMLNNLDIPITFQRGRKLGYALPVKIIYEMTENVTENEFLDCPNHRDEICTLKRLKKIKK